MGLRTIRDEQNKTACFYCSTTEWAFGPVAHGFDAEEQLEKFSKFLKVDARRLSNGELEDKWVEFKRMERANG